MAERIAATRALSTAGASRSAGSRAARRLAVSVMCTSAALATDSAPAGAEPELAAVAPAERDPPTDVLAVWPGPSNSLILWDTSVSFHSSNQLTAAR